MGQVINNVTNTKDAFRWTASFIKSGRLSSEGFLVLAFAADYPLITMGQKYFRSQITTLLRYFLNFPPLAEQKVSCENVRVCIMQFHKYFGPTVMSVLGALRL